MIPSVLAHQVRLGVEDFLRTTFPVSTPFFHGIVDRLLEEEGGVFKGPYLSVQLPFRLGTVGQPFPDVPMKHAPYLHQEQAFQRLRDPRCRSSIVATGTGSGKTESFLFPILDYVHKHRGEPGVKAILIYPMNALAADQALRIARLVHGSDELRGRVTAGLFVGQREQSPRKTMAPDGIITDRETMRLSPPDILLTNYKMLDYLLVRPRDQQLWAENGPESLRYLVVDELHTFDGAQGTDLACLVRRLKSRLQTPPRFLCCVGTSATLGSEEQRSGLLAYAEEIFGEPFDRDAVVGETRKTTGEFLADSLIRYVDIVLPDEEDALDPENYDDADDWLLAQHRLWFHLDGEGGPQDATWRVDLGDSLTGHLFFQNLLKILGGAPRSYVDLVGRLMTVMPDLRKGNGRYRALVLDSLAGLISAARMWAPESDDDCRAREAEARPRPTAPFLNVRIQVWLRELSRLVSSVEPTPILRFSADLTEEKLRQHLPTVHCRACGAMGWTGLKKPLHQKVDNDLTAYYAAFFKDDQKVSFFFPEPETLAHDMAGEHRHLCSACLHLSPDRVKSCQACGNEDGVRVFFPASRQENDRGKKVSVHHCPYCGARNGLTLLGSRAASLTSVLVSQLFASRYNDDKKLLTFSDSVQDASHRAGFFGARTFAFTLRSALLKFLADQPAELSLDALADAFRDYWLARMSREEFVTTFLAHNLTWLHEYEKLLDEGKLPESSKLLEKTCRRVDWELTSEFGFRARVGRTLEKTASAMARPDPARLEVAVRATYERLRNEIGGLRKVEPADVRRFVVGLITRLKNQGSIYHSALETYVDTLGDTYMINRRLHWMPKFGPNTPAPSFLATARGKRFDVLVGGQQTWYERWMVKCLSDAYPHVLNDTREIYDLVLKSLVSAGLVEERPAREQRVWGLRPDAMYVTRSVKAFSCDRCEHASAQPNSEAVLWHGAPCLRGSCDGHYAPRPLGRDYYAQLYQRGDLIRIFTAEHTGLLQRDAREKLEARFKAPPSELRPGDPNLLSCTPTLEMGIDIGDLSSLILCSMPPAQANYLQRIGRAGRRDGNALNITVANARPHDLYFFSEPEEMISGAISPPGVFLGASAVLERQLTAFCFDRWVATGVTEDQLPRQLGTALNAVQKQQTKVFPYNFIDYIEGHRTEIFDRFLGLFDGRLSDDSTDHLRTFLDGGTTDQGSLGWRIVDGLQKVVLERESLRKKARTLQEKLRRKEAEPAKDKNHARGMADLIKEKSALQKLAREIGDRDTLNFFTDEGLIPNYAFPEAGVLLRSIIYRQKESEDGGRRYATRTFDYERPAVSAISELAPANRFYAGGRRVTVDQIDLSVSEVEQWRFCNVCSHNERVDLGDERTACVRCGSPLWADAGQKRPMLRLRQVFATTDDKKSRSGDDSDDRDPVFYNKQMLVDFDDEHVRQAWRIDSDALPFGFEFVQKVAFREINFGQKVDEAERVTIAAVQLPRKGFRICRQCGKVQLKGREVVHALSCTARDQTSEGSLIDCVYLYRDFTSEAVRILLPMTTFSGSERRFHSFVAALHLGLKRHFSGRIDHLQTTSYEEPIADSTYRKKFLILYDTVPGGTGYLKELMRSPQHLLDALEKALDALRACPCNQDPTRDGCYRCLRAYRGSFDLKEISRDVAISLLTDILRLKDRIVEVEGLAKVQVNALFDSELETRFVEALQRARRPDRPVTLTKQVLASGKAGYFLKVGSSAWYVEPQVSLGPADGMQIPSKADFLFTPARQQSGVKPVVVFTDGFTWHRDRVGLDTAQRMAILRTGKMLCWSLSWGDVQNQFKPMSGWYQNYLDASFANNNVLRPVLESLDLLRFERYGAKDSFEWLVAFLENPDEASWQKYAYAQAMARLDLSLSQADWLSRASGVLSDEVIDELTDHLGPAACGARTADACVQWFLCWEKQQAFRCETMHMASWLDDSPQRRTESEFEARWNGWLRLLNLFAFLPVIWFGSATGVATGAYQGLPGAPKVHLVTEAEAGLSAEWQAVAGDCLEDVSSLLPRLQAAGWEIPQVGFELQDEAGKIVGSAELAWPSTRIALLRTDEMDFSTSFEKAGWRAFALADAIVDEHFASVLEPA